MFIIPVSPMFSSKERKPIATVPYESVRFVWVTNHYDVHLHGTCIHKGKLCEFETDFPDFFTELEHMMVRIYSLSFSDRIHWRIKQKLFEICVGRHWSYSRNGTINRSFGIRSKLHSRLFHLYYRARKKGKS